jgi:uncharacterized protein YprB with RNaseH-like and TPR domain
MFKPENLAARLAALRGQAHAGDEAPCGLAERLARHGRRPVVSRSSADDPALAAALGGRCRAPGLIEIDRQIPWPHGAEQHVALSALPETFANDTRDWLFVDTETTGLAGGAGTVVFLIGLARWRDGALAMRQLLMTRFCGEAAMLRYANAWAQRAGFVSYNGKRFDMPLLSTRACLAGVPDIWLKRDHLDLLYSVRRAFASRWPDCRLSTLERRLLNVQRQDDLPGSQAPAAWLDYLRQGDSLRLAAVVAHNRQDLLSLARALAVLGAVHREPPAYAADTWRIASAWLGQGAEARALALLESAAQTLEPNGLRLLALLWRRAGRSQEACRIWHELAKADDQEAIACLAKYYEHVCKDLAAAQLWAQRLVSNEQTRRRLTRLQRKLAGQRARIGSAQGG